ncbi:hypothetical protein AB1A81_08240 [Bdellovibrio bacteriovorus]|uniref:Lipoprotein n=1 Tax=Bdellovibrio bacteriovorus (strain ATCC 15356 / DSM 50701 / NCIMB 9529 / HD100) TaxID=264462 RepID=Q6MM41_BDEBA|nr:hypothetical protein [Bdellovibrio bacteriovorus]CAE79664.1 conserved hypothetical protein [Bdellovibrio bacteriovorus HD100]
MKLCCLIILSLTALGLSSCFWKKEDGPVVEEKVVKVLTPKAEDSAPRDKSLDVLVRYLAEADGIHREAWWVLTAARPPISKSPFGKVQRALLASQNIKLTNKSMFRCDRYLVKRDVLGLLGYPQKGEVFEKCSDKADAKRIASFDVPKEGELNLIFYPENLQEVLGLGAGILNRQIHCSLKGKEKLESLNCKDWAQDRTKEQMIRLDVYDYQKSGKNLIKLRGKVYENLTDIRKIEADVPMEGKITVTETELYAPEEPPVAPAPAPGVTPAPGAPKAGGPVSMPSGQAPASNEPLHPRNPELGMPAGRDVDPDVLLQRQRSQNPGMDMIEVPPENADPSNEGFPEGYDPNNPPVPEPQDESQQQQLPPQEQPQGIPNGR